MWGQAELNLVCTTLGDSLKVPGPHHLMGTGPSQHPQQEQLGRKR